VRTYGVSLQALYVSRNHLTHLNGVQNFQNLSSLSACANAVHSWVALAPLRQLTDLECLNLQDNPVTRSPLYRPKVIAMLPSLRQLDGKPVAPTERKLSVAICGLNDRLLQVAVSQACYVHRLGHAARVARMHKELLAYHHANFYEHEPDWSMARSAACIAQTWSFEELLSTEEREKIEQAIELEAARHHHHRNNSDGTAATFAAWQGAVAHVLHAQVDAVRALGQLLTSLDIKTDTYASTRQSPSGMSSQEAGDDAELNSSCKGWTCAVDAMARTIDELAGLQIANGDAASQRAEECLQEINALQRWMVAELGGQKNGDDVNESPSPSISNASEVRDWWISARTNDDPLATSPWEKKEKQRENIPGSSPAPHGGAVRNTESQGLAQQAEEWRKRAEAAETSLQLRERETAAQQDIVASLQRWLEVANSKSEDAESRAAHAERALEEARGMHKQHVEELQAHAEALRAQKQVALHERDAVRHELGLLQQKELELAQRPSSIELRVDVSFEQECARQVAQNDVLQARLKASESLLLRLQAREKQHAQRSLDLWHLLALRQKGRRDAASQAYQRWKSTALRSGFAAWREAARRMRVIKAREEAVHAALKLRMLRTWLDTARTEATVRALECSAASFAQQAMRSRIFMIWRQRAQTLRDARLLEHNISLRTAKASLNAWSQCVKCEIAREASLHLLATNHRAAQLAQRSLHAWKVGLALAMEERRNELHGVEARKVLLLSRAFSSWKGYSTHALHDKAAKIQAEVHARTRILSIVLAGWREHHEVRKELVTKYGEELRRAETRAKQKSAAVGLRICRGCFDAWLCLVQRRKQHELRKDRLHWRIGNRTSRSCFNAWRDCTREGATKILHARLEQSVQALECVQQALHEAETARSKIFSESSATNHELQRVQSELALLLERCTLAEADQHQAMQERDALQSAMEALQHTYESMEEHHAAELEAVRDIVLRKEQTVLAVATEQDAKLEEMNNRIASLSLSIEQEQRQRIELERELEETARRMLDAEAVAASHQAAVARTMSELTASMEACTKAQNECKRLTQHNRELMDALKSATERAHDASYANRSMEKELSVLREQLRAANMARTNAETAREDAEKGAWHAVREANRLAALAERCTWEPELRNHRTSYALM
jgi:hypothetical protein